MKKLNADVKEPETTKKEKVVEINPENGFPYPTEAQLRSIVKRFPSKVAPEYGGMLPGETRVLRDGTTVKIPETGKPGSMTPEEVYYSELAKKKTFKEDLSMKTYEYMMIKYGKDVNAQGTGTYRPDINTEYNY